MAMIACVGEFWVAVTERGGLVVQGLNEGGQLGLGTQDAAPQPRFLGGVGPIEGDGVAELAGGMEALALLDDLAPGAPAAALAHPFGRKVAMVASGDEHTICVTDDGAVWAWGQNESGVLGISHMQTPGQPAQNVRVRGSSVPLRWGPELCNGAPVRMVACGDFHTLVLTRAGEVWACGNGYHGQTGCPLLRASMRTPERVQGLPAVVHLVAAGAHVSGAVGEDGQVWMWGDCRLCRLGFPPATPALRAIAAPTPLTLAAFDGEPVVHLSLGCFQSAAVTKTGALWVWGGNNHGGLGLGDTADRPIPTLVAATWGGSSVAMAACGYFHQVILTEDGGVWTCGRAENGLLGREDARDTWTPVRLAPEVFGGAKIVFVAAGTYYAFAVTAEGLLYFWGCSAIYPHVRVQRTPTPVAESLAPGQRIGRSCGIPRRHAVAFCMGLHAGLGVQATNRVLGSDTAGAVVARGVRLDGDLAHMGEGLLRQLAVRERRN